MKKLFFALMAVAAIAFTSCTYETGTGQAEWGFASKTDPQGFDVESIVLFQNAELINCISSQFTNSSEWELISATYNGTGSAMSKAALTAGDCEKSAKALFNAGIEDFKKAHVDQGHTEITDDDSYNKNIRLIYRIGTKDYKVLDATVHGYDVQGK